MDDEEIRARLEILDLISEYTVSNDQAEWDRMDRIWADDAVLRVPGVGRGHYEGREVIMSRIRGRVARTLRADSAAAEGKVDTRMSRHHVTSTRISMTDATHAEGVVYYLVVTDGGYDHSGTYRDRYVRTGGRWVIAERDILVEHVADDSHYGFLRPAAALNVGA